MKIEKGNGVPVSQGYEPWMSWTRRLLVVAGNIFRKFYVQSVLNLQLALFRLQACRQASSFAAHNERIEDKENSWNGQSGRIWTDVRLLRRCLRPRQVGNQTSRHSVNWISIMPFVTRTSWISGGHTAPVFGSRPLCRIGTSDVSYWESYKHHTPRTFHRSRSRPIRLGTFLVKSKWTIRLRVAPLTWLLHHGR